MQLVKTDNYLLLIDEEAKIRDDERDYIYDKFSKEIKKSHIVGWPKDEKDIFEDKIIAYYPLTKEAKKFDLPLLPDPVNEAVALVVSKYQEIFDEYPKGGKICNDTVKQIIEGGVRFGFKFAKKNISEFIPEYEIVGQCDCPCHEESGIMHFTPCCHPSRVLKIVEGRLVGTYKY